MTEQVKIDTKKLDEILKNLHPEASKVVSKRGLKVASDWAADVRVDTSAFRNSILSESEMDETDDLLFIAQDGVTYGIFNELGTHKMAAKPSLSQAINQNEKSFIQDFVHLFERL